MKKATTTKPFQGWVRHSYGRVKAAAKKAGILPGMGRRRMKNNLKVMVWGLGMWKMMLWALRALRIMMSMGLWSNVEMRSNENVEMIITRLLVSKL
jgi:hypothetical protein